MYIQIMVGGHQISFLKFQFFSGILQRPNPEFFLKDQ